MFNRFRFGAFLLTGLVVLLTSCNNSPSLTSIVVSPSTMNFTGAGLHTQLTATGYYTHPDHAAKTADITDQVTWTSSTPECVTVNNTDKKGYITSGSNTCTDIPVTASAPGFNGTISGSMTVNVTQSSSTSTEPIASLAVIPTSQTALITGTSGNVSFIAIGTTPSGATVNLTSTPYVASSTQGTTKATWSSSNQAVAAFEDSANPNIATPIAAGTTTITAIATNTDGTAVTGTATLTVSSSTTSTSEPVVSLAITPSSQTALTTGTSGNVNFIAIGTTSSGATVNLTNQTYPVPGTSKAVSAATWYSSNPAVATFADSTKNVATPVAAGTTAITAIATNPDGTVVTAVATLTVSASATSTVEHLVSLAIVPSSQTLTTVGQTASLKAIGTTSSGATVDLTNGTATIKNTSGTTTTFNAAQWASSVPSVAKVDTTAAGSFDAVANGTTAITAEVTSSDGSTVTGTAAITVNIASSAEPLVSLTIIPSSISVAYPGQQGQFKAIGTTSAGTTVDLTSSSASVTTATGTVTIPKVTWSSVNQSVATPDTITAGLFTAQGEGTTAILAVGTNTADSSVVTATASFAVQNAASEPVTAITIIPGSQSIAANQTAQFIALGTDGTTGLQSDVTTATEVVWTSSNPAVATVSTASAPTKTGTTTDADGLVKGVTAGSTTITAEYTNPKTSTTAASVVTQTATVTVTAVTATPEPLLSLTVIPSSATLASIDQTAQFLAIGTTSAGAAEDLTNSVAWTSSEQAVATFNSTGTSGTTTGGVGASAGLATVVGAGTTAITAVATNSDGTVVTGVATLTCPVGTTSTVSGTTTTTTSGCNTDTTKIPAEQLATLTVYGTGSNTTNWLITAPSAAGVADVIHCGPASTNTSSVCVGTYPVGTSVTLTENPESGTFGGWSANCDTTTNVPNLTTTCTVTLANSESVAGIFN
jgi:hypothetical protein